MRPRIQSAIAEELLETGTLRSFRIFDTHGHMGGYTGMHIPKSEPAAMVETMDRCGVSHLVFSHHEALQDMVEGNRKAQEAIDAWPDRFLGYWAVNPRYPGLVREAVASFGTRRGFAGYKILAGYYQTPITLPACEPLWAHAHEARLPVLLHTWGGDTNAGWRQVEEIAARYPGATILMGHSQFGQFDEAIALSRKFPNVYCELTAAYTRAHLIEKMTAGGIEDQITFGTDLPWFDPMHATGCIVFADVSDTVKRKILRDNAWALFERFLRKSAAA
jgi:predicted TIM-barrel fold metal-dependent hydrolase